MFGSAPMRLSWVWARRLSVEDRHARPTSGIDRDVPFPPESRVDSPAATAGRDAE